MRHRYSLVLLILLTLLAFVLRLYRLDFYDYWDDEIITTLAARASLYDIFFSLPDYSVHHMPLYYTLVHVWTRLFAHDHLLTIRLLSVVLGTTCVPLLFVLARDLTARTSVALVAAGVLAVSPMQIVHSQQCRMYPLMTLVVIVAAILFWRAWRQGGWHRWLWFGVAFAAGWYTHVYVPFSLLALDVWAVYDTVRERRIPWRRWAGLTAAHVGGLAAFLPFVPQLLRSIEHAQGAFWLASNTPFDWLPALIEGSNGATLALRAHRNMPPAELVTAAPLPLAALLVGVGAILLVLWVSVRDVQNNPAMVLLHSLLWTPIVVATVLSLTIKPILISRYLIGITPPLVILLAWVGVRLWHHRGGRVLALAFVASIAISLETVYPDTPRVNDRIVLADMLADQQQPGDAIAITHWHMFDTMFLTHPELENLYVIPAPVYDAAYWQRRSSYLGWHTPQHIQPVESFAPDYQRVWLLLMIYDPDVGYNQRVSNGWLDEHGRLVERFDYEKDGMWVLVYEVGEVQE